MNKKKFIQDNITTILVSPSSMEKPVEQRVDFAIAMAEKLWEKLCERGYGEAEKRGSSVAKKLGTKIVYPPLFEKAWGLYQIKIKGDKAKAFEYWEMLDDETHQWILYAAPKYVQSLSPNDKPRHFSTFISGQIWQGFPIKEVKQAEKQKQDAGEIKHIKGLIENTTNEETKAKLIAQMKRLIKESKV